MVCAWYVRPSNSAAAQTKLHAHTEATARSPRSPSNRTYQPTQQQRLIRLSEALLEADGPLASLTPNPSRTPPHKKIAVTCRRDNGNSKRFGGNDKKESCSYNRPAQLFMRLQGAHIPTNPSNSGGQGPLRLFWRQLGGRKSLGQA